ncbi:MAG TPA: IgGFc-binding protein, partial [Polyangia bacterium]
MVSAFAVVCGWSCGSSKVVPLQKPADAGPTLMDVATPAPVFDAVTLPPADAPAPRPPDLAGELTCGASMPGNAGCHFIVAEPFMTGAAGCYALVVVNPGTRPAKLTLSRAGQTFVVEQAARLPRGTGGTLTYAAFDNDTGLAPGDVAILFLAGQGTGPGTGPSDNGCPVGTMGAVAQTTNSTRTSHIGEAFQLTSDQPVVADDINPFGGVYSYLSSASLLIPVESWSGNYVAAVPPHAEPSLVGRNRGQYDTFVIVVASQDDTEITLRPPVATAGADGVPAAAAGQTLRLRLQKGQFAQVMETASTPARPPGMSGTLVSANKPIGVIGGSPCLFLPVGATACDAAHQQMPPLSSWGHEYAAVQHASRLGSLKEESVPW